MPTITEARMAKGKIRVGYTDSNGDYQSTNIKGRANVANYLINQATNQANADLAKQQNDWNFEQWNRENEYNSPANQIALLKSAGLNPNLYQNDGATSSPLESADLANQQAGNPMQDLTQNYLNAFGLGLNNMNAALARDLQRDQIALEKQKVENDRLRVQNETKKTTSEIDLNSRLGNLYDSNVHLNSEQENEIKARTASTYQNINESFQRVQGMILSQGITAKELQYFDSDKQIEQSLKRAQTSESYKRQQLFGAQIGLTKQQTENLIFDAYHVMSRMALESQEFDLNKFNIELAKENVDYQKWIHEFEKEHKETSLYMDRTFQVLDFALDAASTVATFGIGRAIGQAGKGIGQGLSQGLSAPQSPQSWSNMFGNSLNQDRILRGMPAY